jgi:hypothetical protein
MLGFAAPLKLMNRITDCTHLSTRILDWRGPCLQGRGSLASGLVVKANSTTQLNSNSNELAWTHLLCFCRSLLLGDHVPCNCTSCATSRQAINKAQLARTVSALISVECSARHVVPAHSVGSLPPRLPIIHAPDTRQDCICRAAGPWCVDCIRSASCSTLLPDLYGLQVC